MPTANLFNKMNSQTHRAQHANNYVVGMVEYLQEGWDNDDFEEIDEIKERLHTNVKISLNYIDEVIAELQQLNIRPKSVFIRSKSIISQNVLISLSPGDQLKNKFSEIYFVTARMEKNSLSENYKLSFTFTFDDGHLNEEVLACAGYLPVPVL